MSNQNDKPSGRGVTLIVPTVEVDTASATHDRGGGEAHGLGSFVRRLTSKTIDEDILQKNVERCMEQLKELLGSVRDHSLEGWEMEELSVSLAISAEGTVGIATAGAEASIEATFRRTNKV